MREAFEETTASLLLIVDDEPMSRALTKNAFESLFRVECVSSGQEALSFLKDAIPDMILMDLYMPEMDGLETFMKIRELDNCRHLPVIFMTAAEDNATELELFQAGAVESPRSRGSASSGFWNYSACKTSCTRRLTAGPRSCWKVPGRSSA